MLSLIQVQDIENVNKRQIFRAEKKDKERNRGVLVALDTMNLVGDESEANYLYVWLKSSLCGQWLEML